MLVREHFHCVHLFVIIYWPSIGFLEVFNNRLIYGQAILLMEQSPRISSNFQGNPLEWHFAFSDKLVIHWVDERLGVNPFNYMLHQPWYGCSIHPQCGLEFLVNILFTRRDIVETSVGLFFCAGGSQVVVKEPENSQLRDAVIRIDHYDVWIHQN